MRTRNLRFRLSCLLLALCFLLPIIATPALADASVPLNLFVEGITEEQIDTMALDPQSWQFQKEMTWNDLKPNPVVDWKTELQEGSLRNPTAASVGQPKPILGGLILVDYLDRPMISGSEKDDVLGFFMYAQDGSGYDYESGHIKNPVWRVQDFPERYPNGYADLPQFWNDYLNDPTFTEVNNGVTIDEFWREASYGKWAMSLEGHGVYTLPFFEFEMGGGNSFNQKDIPPSFRHAPPTGTSTTVNGSGEGQERQSGYSATMRTISRYGAADAAGVTSAIPATAANPPLGGHNNNTVFFPIIKAEAVDKGIRLGGLRRADPAPYSRWDFNFSIHAGYCTSGSWQPFGQLQSPTRQGLADLVDPVTGIKDPYGPAGRLLIVEEFFNNYPEWIPIYAKRYESGWANSTGVWAAARYNTTNSPDVQTRINEVYRQSQLWIDTLAEYNIWFNYVNKFYNTMPDFHIGHAAAVAGWEADNAANRANWNAADGAFPAKAFKFALPQEDWDWAESYHGQFTYLGLAQERNTRYVSFTSWEGSVGHWSNADTGPTNGGNGWGAYGYPTGQPGARQGENSGTATFMHEFGHVAGWLDNYQSPYSDSRPALTEYWDVMSRGSFSGPYGDLARWSVPGVEGGSMSTLPSFQLRQRGAGPNTNNLTSWYDPGDVLVTSKTALMNGTPVVANIVGRNIPLNFTNDYDPNPARQYSYDFGVPQYDPATGEGFYKAIRLNFGSGTVNGIPLADQAARISNASSAGTVGGGFGTLVGGVPTGNGNFRQSAATIMSIEVVDQTGNDSFAPDSGVMIQRMSDINGTSNTREMISPHLYDIDLVDYFINPEGKPSVFEGDWYRFPVCHAGQMLNNLFKVGKSYVDTGYYGSVRQGPMNTTVTRDLYSGTGVTSGFVAGHHDSMGGDGRIIVPGSVRRWESQTVVGDGIIGELGVEYERPIVGGDTVNEWRDEANRLHFYILGKQVHQGRYGEFLSYEVAVRHFNGQPVGGELIVEEAAPIIPAELGNYTKQTYSITNTGDATDIVRVTLEGDLAANRTRTILVPHNGGLVPSVNEAGIAFTFNPHGRQIYVEREVPTFFSEQSAVIFNDLYAIKAGETIEIEVWVKTTTGLSGDFDLTVKASSETNPAKVAAAGLTIITDALATAYVNQFPGNTNQLCIDVIEFYNDGNSFLFKDVFTIANNASGVYTVGGYKVFVDTKGNTQIRDIHLVDWGLAADRTPPAVEEPGAAFLVSATADKNSVKITGNNDWTVTFNVKETYSDGSDVSVSYSVLVKKNSAGRANLGDYTLIYDIAGNGSNIKDFRVVLN